MVLKRELVFGCRYVVGYEEEVSSGQINCYKNESSPYESTTIIQQRPPVIVSRPDKHIDAVAHCM
jgi:hypothetical protein